MTQVVEPGTLHDVFWQDEVTEAMWWLTTARGSPGIDLGSLQQVLWDGATVGPQHMGRMIEQGLVRAGVGGSYVLTERGRTRGAELLRADARDCIVPEKVCASDDARAAAPRDSATAGGTCRCCGPSDLGLR